MIGGLLNVAQSGLLFLDPERAHELTLRALESGVYPRSGLDDPRLRQRVFGLDFPNPLGMAAGFDKDARAPGALLAMGFGFAEIGTVTPRPQPGNPRPRVFRLIRERGAINRLGFNSGGHEAVRARFAKRPAGIVGVNIGANKDSADPVADYLAGLRVFNDVADYFTVNISSPNTPGLRDLQTPDRLDALLSRLMAEREALIAAGGARRPILVKLAPDIHDDDLPPAVSCLMAHQVDGIILTNTTIARDGVSRIGLSRRGRRPLGPAALCPCDPDARQGLSADRRQAAAHRRRRHRFRRNRARQDPRRGVAHSALYRTYL